MTMEQLTVSRVHWVDISKGVLILLVVWGHLDWIGMQYAGTDAYNYKGLTNFAFLPWYMPAFFILTGFCSNFNRPLRSFIINNFKVLIVPSVLLGVVITRWLSLFLDSGLSWSNFLQIDFKRVLFTAGPWFLAALFVAKLLFRAMIGCIPSRALILICSLLLMLAGTVMYNRHLPNPWEYQHALIALPFLVIGNVLKKHVSLLSHPLLPCLGGGISAVLLLFRLSIFECSSVSNVA